MQPLQADCIFCKIIDGKIPSTVVYQTKHTLVIQDINPQASIHYLIIPLYHVQDVASCTLQDSDFLLDFFSVVTYLSQQSEQAASFKLLTNNGFAAGQRVFHLHFHFMAGKIF